MTTSFSLVMHRPTILYGALSLFITRISLGFMIAAGIQNLFPYIDHRPTILRWGMLPNPFIHSYITTQPPTSFSLLIGQPIILHIMFLAVSYMHDACFETFYSPEMAARIRFHYGEPYHRLPSNHSSLWEGFLMFIYAACVDTSALQKISHASRQAPKLFDREDTIC